MSKSKYNFFETGLLSIGILAAGLGIQENAKADANQVHSKVKYSDHKKHYTVKPKVSYFNVLNSTPQSTSANVSHVSSSQTNVFSSSAINSARAQSTVVQKSDAQKNYTDKFQTSENTSYRTNHKAGQYTKKTTYDYDPSYQSQQQTSIIQKLKSTKNAQDKYNAHVHKATTSENSKAAQSANKFNSAVSTSSSSALSTVNQNSLSYRDAASSSTTTTSSTSSKSSASTSSSDINDQTIQRLITESKRYLGASYEYGGTGKDGSFDCSGFTQYLYQHQKINIPRTAQQQYDSYQHVYANQAKPGDLVFFGSDANDISHVGIYLGNGKMIDAQDQGVIIEAVNAPWWNLIGYARITN